MAFHASRNEALTIQVATGASLVEQTAATELQAYLGRIRGRDIPLTDAPGGKAIVLGTPASSPAVAAQAQALDLSALTPEGFVVAPLDSDRLMIAANDGNGVLYGVYAFLERLGVGFAPRGLALVKDRIPDVSDIHIREAWRESPTFQVRGFHHLIGWPKEVYREGKPFYDTDVRKFLPVYERSLDWMAKHRLNMRNMHLIWFGAGGGEHTRWWSPEGERVDDGVSGLITYRDYPKLQWMKTYGPQVQRNQELLRDIIAYGKARGVKIVIWSGGEIGYPGSLLDHYPELGDAEHPFCTANPATWQYVQSRARELFETFPDLGGWQHVLLTDSGVKAANVFARCSRCGQLDAVDRVVRLEKALLQGKEEAGSEGEIFLRVWGLGGRPGMSDRMGMRREQFIPRLNFAAPTGINFTMRSYSGEPTEKYAFFNSFLGECRRHKQIGMVHQYSEHHGLNCYPAGYLESTWPERLQYFARLNVDGMLLEAGYEPGVVDPTGVNLCDMDLFAYARLAWDPATDRDVIWQDWSRTYFPKAPAEAADIGRNAYRILMRMFYTDLDTYTRVIPAKAGFSRAKDLHALTHWVEPMDRAHAFALVAEKQEAVDLIEACLARLEKIGDKLGRKGELWRTNLQKQRHCAGIFRDFVDITSFLALLRRGIAAAEDAERCLKTLDRLQRTVQTFDPPVPPDMHVLTGWGYMNGEQYRSTFGAFVGACRRELKDHTDVRK